MIGEIGIYIVAPALSTLTAGLVAYTSQSLIDLQKVQKNLLYRVEQNEEQINEIQKKIRQL